MAQDSGDSGEDVTIDRSALESLRETFGDGDDEGSFRDIVSTFVEQTVKLEADLDRFVASGDEVGAARVAHTLKSASLLVGAVQLSHVCVRLEELRNVADPAYAELLVEFRARARAACDVLRSELARD